MPDPTAAPVTETRPLPLWKVWLPSLVILLSAAALALWTLNAHRAERRLLFEQESQRIRSEILDAMHDYEALLMGGAGLLSLTPQPTRAQWEAYVAHLTPTRLGRGVRGLGWAEHVPGPRLAEYLRDMPRRGLPGFALRPAGQRAEYCPVFLVAPLDERNRKVSGFDMYTSPERREAMLRARDTGEPALTARLVLAGEGTDTPQPGCVLFVPVYRQGMPLGSVEERRAALHGFVLSPFRTGDLLPAVLGHRLDSVGLTVHEGAPDPADPARSLLFSGRPQGGDAEHSLRLEAVMAGRLWVLELTGYRPAGTWAVPLEVMLILLLGLLLAGAVYLLVRGIDRTRSRAEDLARQMTQELSQSEEYNRAVFLHSSLPVGVGGPDGRFLDANRAFLEMLGYSREELVGASWLELTHPDDREENARLTREALENRREGYQLEKRFLRKDGSPVWVRLNVGLVRDAEGRVRFFIGTARDISEARDMLRAEARRQVRRAGLLRLHEMQQVSRKELLDFALEQVLCITESKLGYIYEYDDTSRRFTLHSWSAEAMSQCAIRAPQTAYSLDDSGVWGDAVRLRAPVLINDFAAAHPGKRGYPEGHVRLSRFLTVPILCAGRVRAVVGVANKEEPYGEEDVTQLQLFCDGLWGIVERQAAEQELRQVTERFHLAVRAGRIGLWDWDLELGVMHCDPFMEELFGLDDNNRTGTPEDWLCRVHAEDRERVRQALHVAREQGGRFESSFRVQRPGGRVAHIEALAVAHLGPGARPLRLIGVNIDATRLREAEQRLAASHAFLQTVIDTLPHTFFCKDPEGRFLLVNRAFAELHGCAGTSEVLGKTITELEPGPMGAMHQQWDERLKQAGPEACQSYEYSRLLPGGGASHRTVYKSLVRLPEGGLGIVGLNVDSTARRQAEERLEQSHRFLQTVIDTLPIPFVCKDREGRYLLANNAFAALYGIGVAQVLGRTLGEFAPAESAALHAAWDRRLLAPGAPPTLHYELAHAPPGSPVHQWLVFKSLLQLPGGEREGIAGITLDISDLKAAEEALREERRRLADVIEGTNAGTWEWNVHTGETVFNERWAEILGYTLEELAPVSIRTWQELTHPEDLERSDQALALHFSGQTPYYDCECRMRHKDGHWVWVHDRGRVFRNAEDGSPLLMSGTHSDISQRKQAEEQMELMARFPVETPNPVLRADAEGVLLFANPAAAPLLRDWGLAVGGTLPRELVEELGLALSTNRTRSSERSYASGIYTITMSPFVDKGYVNIYGADVTQRKTAELALRQAKARAEAATRAKAQFLANMSHEIRTPLAGVMGATRLLAQSGLDGGQRQLAEMAAQSAQALLDVVNDVLDFSKIEAGQMRIRTAPFALRRFVQGVAAPYGLLAQEHGLRLVVDLARDIPDALVGDEGRLGQVLRNLLSNALKFTEAGGVTLAVRREEGEADAGTARLLFSVSDTGAGIDPDYLPRIFDSFSQADSSYAKPHAGTGLGLAICKNLVEQMGGSITAESEPGRGSTFRVRLALGLDGAAASALAEEPAAYAAPAPAAGEGLPALRVLLADDNHIGRVLMEHVLRRAGHTVTGVASGQEVLEALRREPFDLVLMDVQMPGMDGLAATRAIRQGAAGLERAGVAVVALTAYAGQEDRQHFLAAGMDEAVVKPAEEGPLFAALRRALRRAEGRAQPCSMPLPPQDEAPSRFDRGYIERAFGQEPKLLAVMLEQLGQESLPELRRELAAAGGAGDLGQGKLWAHKARGALGSVGAALGRHLAARAEEAACRNDAQAFAAAVAALLEELQALEGRLAEHKAGRLAWGEEA